MTHRADQIADAAVAALAASATIAADVYKYRMQSFAAEELPAVPVAIGQDSPIEDLGASNVAYLDSLLDVTVTAHCEADTEPEAFAELLRLRAEIHRAMMAGQRDFSLAFVLDTRYAGADAAIVTTDGQRIGGRLETRWLVHYRTSIANPES